jgi:hypothetical protein
MAITLTKLERLAEDKGFIVRFSVKKMIISGAVLLITSVAVAALRVAKVLPANLIFDLFSFICLIGGSFIGMMGIFTYVKQAIDSHRRSDERHRKS